MTRVRVKICGTTSAADAALAASLGADFIGVIFAESPRRVDVPRAAEIRAAAPALGLVGVFRDASPDDVAAAARDADLDLIQLHGGESPGYCDEILARTGKPIIKVFSAPHEPPVADLAAYTRTSYFLFDSDKNGGSDDTGRLERVASIRRLGFRLFLAGGLTPANVRDAVRATQPFAVDVCRGVERAPGVKDAEALARFIAEVNA